MGVGMAVGDDAERQFPKRPGNVIVFPDGLMPPMTTPQGGPWAVRQPQAISDPLSGLSKVKTGSGF